MALNTSELIKLAKVTAKANRSSQIAYSFGDEKFSCADLNETLRNELRELAGTYQLYRENKNTIFTLIEETITDVLPQRVMEQYGTFAEFKTIGQGQRAVFTQRITESSRRRAKQFITKVGLAGRYEVFKLDGKSMEVVATAFGGAAQISIEEFLDGRVDFADLIEIVMDGLNDRIYEEIEKALIASVETLQDVNQYTGNGFSETEMDKLLTIADSYGQSTIYCTFEFAATMLPKDNNWVSDAMKDQRWNAGYLANYKGHNVIVFRQSFTDETNKVKVIDPSYAWIIPTGADKPVKITFEGETLVKETEQDDWSRHIDVYKKVGVGAMVSNNICVYKNEDLTKEI